MDKKTASDCSNDKPNSPAPSREIAADDDDDNQNIISRDLPSPSHPTLSSAQLSQELDLFLEALSKPRDIYDNAGPPEAPQALESLSKMLESMIDDYSGEKTPTKMGRDPERDASFFTALQRISAVSRKLCEFPCRDSAASPLHRSSCVVQRAMSLLDEEFRAILRERKPVDSDQKSLKTAKQFSFNHNTDSDHCLISDSDSAKDEEFPDFSPEELSSMNKITQAMFSAGYGKECCLIYGILRKSAFSDALCNLGYDGITIEDVHRMQWESLESEILKWIAVVKKCSALLLPGERKLSDSVFADHPSTSQDLFGNLARAVVMQLLNFADAVVLTKRGAEKLFKFLDMYETLGDLMQAIKDLPGDGARELVSEIEVAKSRIGESAVSIFCELENSIKSDSGRTPVPSGAVHPLTRYVMNYLKYACEYKDTLEQVFQRPPVIAAAGKDHKEKLEPERARSATQNEEEGNTKKKSPFARQLRTAMDLLDANLDTKSRLYRDSSLRYVFLMNNGRYIVQKMKGSEEIRELLGDAWYRKRSSDLRQYHKNYQRDTWSKVLQCLKHEGLQVNGKVSKPILKERFKSFNAMFDEIHRVQSMWVVSDEQLQSELRVSVSAVMIPAYRSFLGRFKQYLDPGRQTEKYIKYQPEDIETSIDELFDGNLTSMGRKR